jgi:small subunit ribosomal protein S9
MATGKKRYWQGVGRRKKASAYVKLFEGKGNVKINKKEVDPDQIYLAPLKLLGLDKKLDVVAQVKGGGTVSQKEAIRLGIVRALIHKDKKLKPTLRKANFVTRDPR